MGELARHSKEKFGSLSRCGHLIQGMNRARQSIKQVTLSRQKHETQCHRITAQSKGLKQVKTSQLGVKYFAMISTLNVRVERPSATLQPVGIIYWVADEKLPTLTCKTHLHGKLVNFAKKKLTMEMSKLLHT